jgi:hypothetical protein
MKHLILLLTCHTFKLFDVWPLSLARVLKWRCGQKRTPQHILKIKIVQGLYVVTDIYPFHLQARKVDPISQIRRLLTFLACLVEHMDDGQPRIAIFIALRVWFSCSSNYVRWTFAYTCNWADLTYSSWRWAYGIGSLYGFVVVLLVALVMEETWVPIIFP